MKRTDARHNARPSYHSRRDMLRHCGTGFGLLALSALLAQDQAKAEGERRKAEGPNAEGRTPNADPLAERPPHFPPRAKRVIFLFMSGGPSHVDLFDPKPRLKAETGKPLPFPMPALMRTKTGNLLGSPFSFARHGQAGIE